MENERKENTGYTLHLSKDSAGAWDFFERVSQEISLWMDSLENLAMDEEAVHDIRVTIRQLRSMMTFYKPLFRKDAYNQGQKLLKSALRFFESARETDVLLLEIASFEKNLATFGFSHVACFWAPLDQWKADLSRIHENELASITDLGEATHWKEALKNWTLLVQQKPFRAKRTGTNLEKFSKKRMRLLLLLWLSHYKDLDPALDDKVHKSRVDLKKIRYMLRAMEGTVVHDSAKLLKCFEAYQDNTGELHDIHRFEPMMDEDTTSARFAEVQRAFLQFEKARKRKLKNEFPHIKQELQEEICSWIDQCNC